MSTTTVGSDRIETLDGLRGICVLLVLWGHSDLLQRTVLLPAPGQFGVYVFFVLSGFLITRILLRERDKGLIGLGRFLAHRSARIFPLYLAAMLVFAVLFGLNDQFWRMLTYSYSLGIPIQLTNVWGWGTTWSLDVEEHWYLVWPLLIFAMPRRWVGPAALAMISLGVVYAIRQDCDAELAGWTIDTNPRFSLLYNGTIQNAPMLAAGAILAVYESSLRTGYRILAVAVASVIIAAMLPEGPIGHKYTYALIALALVCLAIWHADNTGWSAFRSTLTDPVLRYIGAISYGLYLIHGPLFQLFNVQGANDDRPHMLAAALGLTFGLAAASHRWFEEPIRKYVRGKTG